MLAAHAAIATVAVKDLAAAKRFYGDTLGLTQVDAEGEEAVTFATGTGKLIVYRSTFAGTNQATAVNWNVGGEVDAITRELASKGVTFEHYDLPGLAREGDVHVAPGMRVSWFKDPDGNIHSLMGGS
ncbi:MAG: VOC family protein [bacterium]